MYDILICLLPVHVDEISWVVFVCYVTLVSGACQWNLENSHEQHFQVCSLPVIFKYSDSYSISSEITVIKITIL
jgi:hypothetical protein